MTPVWGACADRFCKNKVILLLSVLGWLVSNFLLFLVPANYDLNLCDAYEDNVSHQGNQTILQISYNDSPENYKNLVIREDLKRLDFYSRISPYLDTTVPFFPITFQDFQDVCSSRLQHHNNTKDVKTGQDQWQEKPNVEIVNSRHPSQHSFQDPLSGVSPDDKHLSCRSTQFIYLLCVTVIGTIIAAPAQALADTATLQSLHGETHKYGRVRLWGSLGWGLGGFSVGAAVSTNKRTNYCGEVVIDYGPCFYVYIAAMGIAFLCASQFQFEQNEESEVNSSKTNKIIEGLKVFRSPQFCFIIFIAFFCGSATGFIETFLFWYLHELGGGQLLFSVINGLNCAAEVCVFFVTDKLLSFLGHINVIYLALFSYSLRFVYFYFIHSPWTVLPAELLQGITTAALWSSCVSYVGLHPGASNTVQGILNGVYMGLGFATGGFMGGLLVNFIGMKLSFLLYSFASLFCLVSFAVVNKANKI